MTKVFNLQRFNNRMLDWEGGYGAICANFTRKIFGNNIPERVKVKVSSKQFIGSIPVVLSKQRYDVLYSLNPNITRPRGSLFSETQDRLLPFFPKDSKRTTVFVRFSKAQ
jgi:hypothetical protein